MNPLRVVGDLLAGRPRPPYVHPVDDQPAVGLPDWGERHELMRRGDADCRNPDHTDALIRLGATIWKLRQAEQERDEARATADLWRKRALRAEATLRHPSTGERPAA